MDARRSNLLLKLDTSPEAKMAAAKALYRHNIDKTGIADRQPIGATVSDGETVLGGLWGRTELGVLFLDMFFLPEDLRGGGWGGRLLALVEAEAVRRGCLRAVVETSTFQAPDFYQRHGYREFGRVDFAVAGSARVFFVKEFGLEKTGNPPK